jgi:hypothetical protein
MVHGWTFDQVANNVPIRMAKFAPRGKSIGGTFMDFERTIIHKCLCNILASSQFRRTAQLRAMLTYIVTHTLMGTAVIVKEYTIAIDVLLRPPDFDTARNNIVRVQACKLRTKLSNYYAHEGKNDPIRIMIPKGGYSATFDVRCTAGAPLRFSQPHRRELDSQTGISRLFLLGAAASAN